MSDKKAGQYDYDGSCMPREGQPRLSGQTSFSVGVFQWINMAHGKGLKRGKVLTRVSGLVSEASIVVSVARDVCRLLQNGTIQPGELKKTIPCTAGSYVTKDAAK